MTAAAFNHVAMIAWLLDHGADGAARDAAGLSVLDIARAMGASDLRHSS